MCKRFIRKVLPGETGEGGKKPHRVWLQTKSHPLSDLKEWLKVQINLRSCSTWGRGTALSYSCTHQPLAPVTQGQCPEENSRCKHLAAMHRGPGDEHRRQRRSRQNPNSILYNHQLQGRAPSLLGYLRSEPIWPLRFFKIYKVESQSPSPQYTVQRPSPQPQQLANDGTQQN